MSRYIDADALLEMLNDKAKTDLEMGLYNHGALTQSFIRFVERRPTADVAPSAEAARKIFEELEQESFGYADEDGDWFCVYEKDYEEIKKKHLAATGTNDSGKDMI